MDGVKALPEERPLLHNGLKNGSNNVVNMKTAGLAFTMFIVSLLGIRTTHVGSHIGVMDAELKGMTKTEQNWGSLLAASDTTEGIMVQNKYIARDGGDARPSEYPWLKNRMIIEPFHETIFSAMPVNGATRAQSETYDWRIERLASGQNKNELDLKASRRRLLAQKGYNMADIDEKDPEYDDGVVLTSTSRVLVHTFDELGLHHITMVNKANDGDSPLVAEFFVKYVRKELHSIDDEDREKLFAAWKVLLELTDDQGTAEYGSDFRSHGRLSTEHNNLAGDRMCDHLHDGMGFVPGHISVTRLLEASLQSVDSSIALPYWEYTIDVEEVIANHDGNFQHWRKMLPFTDKWFGEAREDTGHVETGTFGHFRLYGNEFTTKTNAYGLIRSPWNNLGDPRFARYFGGGSALNEAPVIFVDSDQMSTCEILEAAIAASTTLGTFNGEAAGQAHGPIHMFTGGQSNTRDLVPRMASLGFKSSSHIHNQLWGNGVTFMFNLVKSLWRYHLFECPAACTMDTPQEDCLCVCDAGAIMATKGDGIWNNLLETWVTSFERSVTDQSGNETLFQMLELMCDYHGVTMGDHASSGATSDPSFWVIHGTVERWLQLIRMQDGFTDGEDWGRPVFDSNIHPYTESCSGHHQDDKLVFGEVDGHHFTNGEYYEYLTPKESNLPYVYDNFLWPHCTALGYHIQNAPKKTTSSGEGTINGGVSSGAAGHEGEDSPTDDVPYTEKPSGVGEGS